MARGEIKPLICFDVVLSDALAEPKEESEAGLRERISLIGSPQIPAFGFRVVFFQSPSARFIILREVELGLGIAFLRPLAQAKPGRLLPGADRKSQQQDPYGSY